MAVEICASDIAQPKQEEALLSPSCDLLVTVDLLEEP